MRQPTSGAAKQQAVPENHTCYLATPPEKPTVMPSILARADGNRASHTRLASIVPGPLVRTVVTEYALLGGLVALYGAGASALVAWKDTRRSIAFNLYAGGLSTVIPASMVAFIVAYLLYVMVFVRPARLFDYLGAALRTNLRLRERLISGVPMIFLISVVMSIFSSWKILIPALQPFSWDAALSHWDAVLHGGTDPWRWLQPLLGTPPLTSAINAAYQIWMFLFYFVLLWQAFSVSNRSLRLRYFIAVILSWSLLGNGLATLLSSAGPCYFERVVGQPGPYGDLMAYLGQAGEQVPVWSLGIQKMLWDEYESGTFTAAFGISAMPSMHVSSTVLMTLLAWRIGPRLGLLLSVYCVLILIGSVHLGWHYALDGYVATAATLAIWWLAGHIAMRWQQLTAMAPLRSESSPSANACLATQPGHR